MKRELASRVDTHGAHVTLIWFAAANRVEIQLATDLGEVHSASVPNEAALDAFHHPYLYLDPATIPVARAA